MRPASQRPGMFPFDAEEHAPPLVTVGAEDYVGDAADSFGDDTDDYGSRRQGRRACHQYAPLTSIVDGGLGGFNEGRVGGDGHVGEGVGVAGVFVDGHAFGLRIGQGNPILF